MINKYLEEIGIDNKNNQFKIVKNDNRYIPDDLTGLSESDTWDMRISLAMIIYTYLRKFQETKRISYPADLTVEKWEDILKKMIEGFASIIKGEESKRAFKRQKRALSLFKTYFWDLWW